MKVIKATQQMLETRTLVLGFQGENLRTQLRIDCAATFAEYPNATPALAIKPPTGATYPVFVERDGNEVVWDIVANNLLLKGDGELQLTFYKGAVIAKTSIGHITVNRSLQIDGEMPDVVATWIENANRKLAEVDAQIVELEGMVDTATDAATRAEQSASTASTKAEQAAGSAATATAKATEATNAAGTATAKAAEAQTAAQTATEKANAAVDSERIATAKAVEATTAAGTATAKAEQATEAAQTATEKAADASASATAAQASATNAASSATAASASETAAKASETAASTSASQAAQSVLDAGANAQTAMQKAAEATQSATNAATSATNAATSAETASTKAGEAAQSAQAVAETAEQLTDSLEQISQNTADIAEHEQEYNALKEATLIHNTASGAIASFPDGAEMPVDELKVSIEPVQDLHGYDHPWPSGGGKNKCNAQNPIVIVNAGNIGNTPCVISAGTYTYSATTSANVAFQLSAWTSGGTQIGSWSSPTSVTGRHSITFTISEEAAYIRCYYNGATTISDIQVESGSTATSYEPYSNICPITGWTAAKVTRTGKNLLKMKAYQNFSYNAQIGREFTPTLANHNYVDNGDGSFAISGLGSWEQCSLLVPAPVAGKYYLSLKIDGGPTISINKLNREYVAVSNSTYLVNPLPASETVTRMETITEPGYILVYIGAHNAEITITNPSCQYEEPITDYEQYAGNTYDITLPTEAGTVYGGELTVNADGSGSLVVDRAVVDLGTLAFSYDSSGKRWQILVPDIVNYPSRNANILAEKYAADVTAIAGDIGKMFTTGKGLYIYDIDNENAPSGSFVYPLAIPTTYTLTAPEITTLLGENNLWHDANGDIAVGYKANTKLYIDGKIAELVAQIVNS